MQITELKSWHESADCWIESFFVFFFWILMSSPEKYSMKRNAETCFGIPSFSRAMMSCQRRFIGAHKSNKKVLRNTRIAWVKYKARISTTVHDSWCYSINWNDCVSFQALTSQHFNAEHSSKIFLFSTIKIKLLFAIRERESRLFLPDLGFDGWWLIANGLHWRK